MKKFTINDVYDVCNEIGLVCLSKEYINVKAPLVFICTKCGKQFKRNFDNLKSRRSSICATCGKRIGFRKTAFFYDDVKEFVEKTSGSGCRVISEEYINADSLMKFMCSCGNIFETTYYRFKNRNKRQCNECGLKLLSISNATPISTIVREVENAGYTFFENALDGGDQKILVQCESKHDPYWVTWAKFRSGRRCPQCYLSLGESAIAEQLDLLELKYIQEWEYEDLIGLGGGNLRFDFKVFGENGNFLIEYDGKQHFEIAFGDKELFKRTQAHDKLKNEYAAKNNIPLYRIKYTEYDSISKSINNINNKYKI